MSDKAANGLLISFINVGDGDAILIRESSGFTMLVDAGRGDVNPNKNSRRGTCAAFLRDMGVRHIDVLVITHLHEDHVGGLREVMNAASIDTVYSAFFPEAEGLCADEPQAEKTVRGLIVCLNRWAEDVRELRKRASRLIQVDRTVKLAFGDKLTSEIIVRDEPSAAIQNGIYEGMLGGKALSQEQKAFASKLRNPNSLRIRLYFASRAVELSGDCYGNLWENKAEKCDLFKVPHHGDCKSLTPALARALSPRDAVISCASEYMPEKDRPSAEVAEILRRAGSRVWYVDSFSDGVEKAVKRRSLNFAICADGRVEPGV